MQHGYTWWRSFSCWFEFRQIYLKKLAKLRSGRLRPTTLSAQYLFGFLATSHKVWSIEFGRVNFGLWQSHNNTRISTAFGCSRMSQSRLSVQYTFVFQLELRHRAIFLSFWMSSYAIIFRSFPADISLHKKWLKDEQYTRSTAPYQQAYYRLWDEMAWIDRAIVLLLCMEWDEKLIYIAFCFIISK